MDLPRNYNELAPTVLSKEQCHFYLGELLDFIENNNTDRTSVAEALSEMVTRFSDNYIGFNTNDSKRILNWAKHNWDGSSEAFVDAMLSALAYCGLDEEVRNFTAKLIESEKSKETKGLLVEFLDEFVR